MLTSELILLCVKIFFVRILDVSIGTIRTVITVRGKSFTASLVGLFEVFIWFMIVREALNTDYNGIWLAISYSLGFATGTYIGSIISNKLIDTNCGMQIVTENQDLVTEIRNHGYGVTVLDTILEQNETQKYFLFVETTNKHVDKVKNITNKLDSKAFIVVTETKMVHNGFFK